MSFKMAKGITLIALVISILIIIILATVTINFVFGENGLVTMAMKAKESTERARENEISSLLNMENIQRVSFSTNLTIS